jgi:hypothetical protein
MSTADVHCVYQSDWSVVCICATCRLKATLERLQRLTEEYSEQLLELLPPVADALGAALGVAQHAITTFTEAEIRANVVFQVCDGRSTLPCLRFVVLFQCDRC